MLSVGENSTSCLTAFGFLPCAIRVNMESTLFSFWLTAAVGRRLLFFSSCRSCFVKKETSFRPIWHLIRKHFYDPMLVLEAWGMPRSYNENMPVSVLGISGSGFLADFQLALEQCLWTQFELVSGLSDTVRHCQRFGKTALAYDQSNILQLPLVLLVRSSFSYRGLFERLDPLFKVQSLNLVQDNDGADMLWCGCVWYWLRLPHKLCSYWTAFSGVGRKLEDWLNYDRKGVIAYCWNFYLNDDTCIDHS